MDLRDTSERKECRSGARNAAGAGFTVVNY